MINPVDYSVYLVTDRELCLGRGLEEVVAQAVRGGAGVVQLREKLADTGAVVELGRALKVLLDPLGVPLIINDRVDVALAVGASGVHVGQSDMAYEDVRRILGPNAIIGLSVENLEHVRHAVALKGVDYLGIGPIFLTDTKRDAAPAMGLEVLSRARDMTRLPLVAIGGVNEGNAESVVRAGADGVAVVSAICSADDPGQAARTLLAQVRGGGK